MMRLDEGKETVMFRRLRCEILLTGTVAVCTLGSEKRTDRFGAEASRKQSSFTMNRQLFLTPRNSGDM